MTEIAQWCQAIVRLPWYKPSRNVSRALTGIPFKIEGQNVTDRYSKIDADMSAIKMCAEGPSKNEEDEISWQR